MDRLKIGDKLFSSRLFLGSGKFGNLKDMERSIISSGSQLVTIAMKRIDKEDDSDEIYNILKKAKTNILPNTSGARDYKEAVLLAELGREAFETNFVKLEIHPDPKYLMPDPLETLKATEVLAKDNFVVMPYINADPVLCKRLEDVGTSVVMPLGSPIGSNKGLLTKELLKIIIEQSNVPVIIDAGIGAPSDASLSMEIGADAVLVNTAIATSKDPIKAAKAFKYATEAGRSFYINGLSNKANNNFANPTSPLISFLED